MRTFKHLVIGFGAAVVLAGLPGCSWHRDDGRTAGRVVDDKHIESEVASRLAREPVYKFRDVDVKTYNGVVQLSGFVNSEEQKRRAAEIAQQVPGVAQVIDNTTVVPEPGPTPTGRTNQPPVTTTTTKP